METTYTMIGVDGLQYGPITLDQLKAWIVEGRVTADTKILRSDTNSWLRAAQYVELDLAPAPPTAPTAVAPMRAAQPASQPLSADPMLLRRVRSAATWFFFIGALSAVNTLMAVTHQGGFFLVGLGVNLLIANQALSLLLSGIFALFGVFARLGHTWSFIVGMVLYALDAVVFYNVHMWLPFAFHIYALFRIGLGLKANMDLKAQSR